MDLHISINTCFIASRIGEIDTKGRHAYHAVLGVVGEERNCGVTYLFHARKSISGRIWAVLLSPRR